MTGKEYVKSLFPDAYTARYFDENNKIMWGVYRTGNSIPFATGYIERNAWANARKYVDQQFFQDYKACEKLMLEFSARFPELSAFQRGSLFDRFSAVLGALESCIRGVDV